MAPGAGNTQKRRRKKKSINTTQKNTYSNNLDQATLTALLIGMIVTGGIPTTIVENPFFLTIVSRLAPWYRVPCRKTVMTKIVKTYKDGILSVAKKLVGKTMALTFDLATVLNSTRQFLVVSGHFIDVALKKIVTLTLGVRQMQHRSDSDSIQLELKQMLKLYNIGNEQVRRVATDGGGNVKKAVTSLFGTAAQSFCVCHLLNLLVEQSFGLSPIISAFLRDVKAIVTFFKMSPVAMNMLRTQQTESGQRALVLIQSIATRWNSQLNCIKRFLKLESVVCTVLNDPVIRRNAKASTPKALPADVIPILKDVVTLLEPIDELTKAFSTSKMATSSIVLLALKDAHQRMSSMELNSNVARDFQHTLTNKLGTIMQNLDQDLSLSCAQLLDPRFKGNILTADSKRKAEQHLQELLTNKHAMPVTNPNDDDEPHPPPTKRLRTEENLGTQSSLLSRLRRKFSSDEVQQPEDDTVNDELRVFLNSSLLDHDADPIAYWLSKEADAAFPSVTNTALDFLLTPASSVASERIVSAVNFILRDSRSSLTSSNLNAIVVLRSLSLEIWSNLIGIKIDSHP